MDILISFPPWSSAFDSSISGGTSEHVTAWICHDTYAFGYVTRSNLLSLIPHRCGVGITSKSPSIFGPELLLLGPCSDDTCTTTVPSIFRALSIDMYLKLLKGSQMKYSFSKQGTRSCWCYCCRRKCFHGELAGVTKIASMRQAAFLCHFSVMSSQRLHSQFLMHSKPEGSKRPLWESVSTTVIDIMLEFVDEFETLLYRQPTTLELRRTKNIFLLSSEKGNANFEAILIWQWI